MEVEEVIFMSSGSSVWMDLRRFSSDDNNNTTLFSERVSTAGAIAAHCKIYELDIVWLSPACKSSVWTPS